MPIPLMKPWNFSAVAPTAIRPVAFHHQWLRALRDSVYEAARGKYRHQHRRSPPPWPISLQRLERKFLWHPPRPGPRAVEFFTESKIVVERWSRQGNPQVLVMLTKPFTSTSTSRSSARKHSLRAFYTDPAILEIEKSAHLPAALGNSSELSANRAGEVNGEKRTIADPGGFFTADVASRTHHRRSRQAG